MKNIRKMTIIGLLTIIFATVSIPKVAEAASWMRNSVGWWLQEEDGSYPVGEWKNINGKRYYFDEQGYMTTGWFWDGQNWYYFGDANDGAMVTGWCQVGGQWYYMYSDGKMVSNTWIDSYWVNQDGAWVPNETPNRWVQVGNKWWYRHTGGSYTTNDWELIDGQWYHFDANGWMQHGWLKDNGNWYYLGAENDGAMKTNQWIGDYYVGADGVMATSQWIGKYYVDETGKWDSTKIDCEDDSENLIITQEQIEERRLLNQSYREQLTQTAGYNYISKSETIYQFGMLDINGDGVEELFIYTYNPVIGDNGPNYMLTITDGEVSAAGMGFGSLENVEYCVQTKHFINTHYYEDGSYDFRIYEYQGVFFSDELIYSGTNSDYQFAFHVDAKEQYSYGDIYNLSYSEKLTVEQVAYIEQKMAEYLPTRTKLTAPHMLTQENLDRYLPIDDAGIIAQLTEEI